MRDVTVQVAGNIGDAAVAAKNEPRQHLEQQLESFGEANTTYSYFKTVYSTHQNAYTMSNHDKTFGKTSAVHLLGFIVIMRI